MFIIELGVSLINPARKRALPKVQGDADGGAKNPVRGNHQKRSLINPARKRALPKVQGDADGDVRNMVALSVATIKKGL